MRIVLADLVHTCQSGPFRSDAIAFFAGNALGWDENIRKNRPGWTTPSKATFRSFDLSLPFLQKIIFRLSAKKCVCHFSNLIPFHPELPSVPIKDNKKTFSNIFPSDADSTFLALSFPGALSKKKKRRRICRDGKRVELKDFFLRCPGKGLPPAKTFPKIPNLKG